jgi:hypothetical protein
MVQKISQILDSLSEFFARRKGLLPMTGIILVICNGLLQFFPGMGWLVSTNLLLHLGVIIALFGFLLAWAL